jgi:RNA polymerase sigma factor (sigma-70 family)
MTEDAELLNRFAADGSEAAFAELTRRHIDLVYSAALRLMNGDVHSAQDVAQQVFTEVARQATRLARHPALVGWLYTTTRLMALRMQRTEQRRKSREQEANIMNELLHDDAPPSDWNQLRPVIEDAMHELDEKDRHAILLRFFQNKTLNEMGAALNLSENAAHMRVERALEKLRGKLARRGITTTAIALAAVVSVNAVQAAPAGLAATVSGAAIAGSAVHASTLIAASKAIAMTTFQKTIVATALAAAVGAGIYSARHGSQLNAQIQTLQQQQAPLTARLQQLEQEHTQAAAQLAALSEENVRLKSGRNASELLKLRGEVGVLRQQAASNEGKASPPGGLAGMMSDPAFEEYLRQSIKEKMTTLYADLITELKLTPEQKDQFLKLLSEAASKSMSQLAATAQGSTNQSGPDPWVETGKQLYRLLGETGINRFRDYSAELPGRATLALLNSQPETAALSAEQSASLIKVMKAEPADLTQGLLGGPDAAFMGSPAEIDSFLQRVTESNQRILQQAGSFLAPDQLAALDHVLTDAIEKRKLQGAAYFKKQ